MKDFEGAPLFDDSAFWGLNSLFVATEIGHQYVLGLNSYGNTALRNCDELRPLNADARAFLAIAKGGAK